MPRFEIEVEGPDLGRAMAALNGAGIPTIASGGGFPTGVPKVGAVRRFFRSTAFPILLVIVLAFFAQRLIDPGESENAPSYDQFIAQVEQAPQTISKVTLDPDDTSIEVVQVNGEDYEMGYPPQSEEALVNLLRRQQIETVVEETGGGTLISWVAYLLPFLLFIGFWMFAMRGMKRERLRGGERLLEALRAVVEADTAEQAAERVHSALPMDGSYRIGKPQE